MIVQIPRYPIQESSFEVEEMMDSKPSKSVVFHEKNKSCDYSHLKAAMAKGKIRK